MSKMSIIKMVKSDGNGSMIVDKKLFWLMGVIITTLITFLFIGVQSTVSTMNENRASVSENRAYDEGQEKRIITLEKQFDRIEVKLDKLIERK